MALFYTSGPTVSALWCASVLISANKSLQATCDKFLSLSVKQDTGVPFERLVCW